MAEKEVKESWGYCFFDKTRKCNSTCMAWLPNAWIDLDFNNKKDEDEPEIVPCRIIRALEAMAEKNR